MNNEEANLNRTIWILVLLTTTTAVLAILLYSPKGYLSSALLEGYKDLSVFFYIILLSFLLYYFYSEKRWEVIILIELIIGMLAAFVGLFVSFDLLGKLVGMGVSEDYVNSNYTLLLILFGFILQCIILLTIKTFFGKFIYTCARKLLNPDLKYMKISSLIKLQSASQFNKAYSILVIIITVIWLNTDGPTYSNSLDELFRISTFLIVFAMSVYSNHLIHFLLTDQVNDIKNIRT